MFQQAFPELGSDRLLFIIKLVGIYHDKTENKRENCRRIFFLYRTGMSYESRKGEGGGGGGGGSFLQNFKFSKDTPTR